VIDLVRMALHNLFTGAKAHLLFAIDPSFVRSIYLAPAKTINDLVNVKIEYRNQHHHLRFRFPVECPTIRKKL
jgi:hypothetical protein